ncbi:MAG: glycerate kinase [Isosphaeraceae bacterium]
MNVVVAPDKFRGSLSAPQAAEAMSRGVRAADSFATIDLAPMADGGEGTVEALVVATQGEYRFVRVTGPLGQPVDARFGILGDGQTAVIEMAAASGLALIPVEKRDPGLTTSRGTGELILAAIDAGVRRIILGIGGSATNDGGVGCAQALGYRFLDRNGSEIGPGGKALESLDRIDASACHPIAQASGLPIRIDVACDVDNPLCGERGASVVYGPQKGASPDLIVQLDRNLARLASCIERDLGRSVADLPGAGAAGGLGAGLVAFAGATLQRGVDLVIDSVRLRNRLASADLCLTGEGAIDGSSAFGKTAVGVARLARSLGCPTLALAGTIGVGAEDVLPEGILAYFSLCPGPVTLEQAQKDAESFLARATEQAVRCFLAGVSSGLRPDSFERADHD